MPVDPVVAGYLAAVADDLAAALRLAAPPANRLAAYHLQQAAEKLVKAVLVHRRIAADVAKLAKLQQQRGELLCFTLVTDVRDWLAITAVCRSVVRGFEVAAAKRVFFAAA